MFQVRLPCCLGRKSRQSVSINVNKTRKHFARNTHSWRAHVFPMLPSSHTGNITSSVSLLFSKCKLCLRYTAGNFKIRACEHEQASTHLIFASNSSKGQILRALSNWMGFEALSSPPRRNLKMAFSLWKLIRCFPSTLHWGNLKIQPWAPDNLDLWFRKALVGKLNDYRDVIVFEKFPFSKRFPSTLKRKAGVFNFPRFEERFWKAPFRGGLVRAVGFTVEIRVFKFFRHSVNGASSLRFVNCCKPLVPFFDICEHY